MVKCRSEVDKIILGTKRYEYLSSKGKYLPDSIFCYVPEYNSIMVEVEVLGVKEEPLLKMWEDTSEYSGCTKESFFNFYGKKRKAYAYILGKITIYDPPFLLSELKIPYSWDKETTLHI